MAEIQAVPAPIALPTEQSDPAQAAASTDSGTPAPAASDQRPTVSYEPDLTSLMTGKTKSEMAAEAWDKQHQAQPAVPNPIPLPTGNTEPIPLPTQESVNQSQALAATAGNRTISMLDMLRDHGHIMEDLEHNATSGLNAEAAKGIFGKGSFFGTPETDLPGTENETWLKRKSQILGKLNTTPILKLDNAITPEEQAAHPHLTAGDNPVYRLQDGC